MKALMCPTATTQQFKKKNKQNLKKTFFKKIGKTHHPHPPKKIIKQNQPTNQNPTTMNSKSAFEMEFNSGLHEDLYLCVYISAWKVH